jgi:hypothetical protein
MSSELIVQRGTVTLLRLVDVAYSIDLARVEALWSAHPRAASSRARLDTTPPKAMAFGNPPVRVALEAERPDLGEDVAAWHASASFHDFGAVALALHVEVAGLRWQELIDLTRRLDAALGPGARTPWWDALWAGAAAVVGPALDRPSDASLREDYCIVAVRDFGEVLDGEAVLARADLVALLGGEQRPLSEAARQDLLRLRYSYYADDLVVITWDRAFVYEPRGDSDVLDVLEVANAQLLELRYYDELLDAELPRMYEQVEGARKAVALFAARRFAHLARRLYTLVAEVTELTERVDNALQVTEDVYLARVYSAALALFRVPTVAAAVERKLAIVRDTYAALYDEASSRRAELLEIAIVVLIVAEIGLALRA